MLATMAGLFTLKQAATFALIWVPYESPGAITGQKRLHLFLIQQLQQPQLSPGALSPSPDHRDAHLLDGLVLLMHQLGVVTEFLVATFQSIALFCQGVDLQGRRSIHSGMCARSTCMPA